MLEGAVVSCEGSPETIAAALGAVMRELGCSPSSDTADIDIEVMAHDGKVTFSGELTKSFAAGIARRLARTLRGPVRLVTARLVEKAAGNESIECELGDVTVSPDGSQSPGRWAEDTTDTYGADWGQICDGKAYAAVRALLDEARHAVLPHGEAWSSLRFRAPASLGSARLDEIARQVRFADRAVLATMAGRRCVRVTTVGTTTTSFVEEPEADALRRALGALLAET